MKKTRMICKARSSAFLNLETGHFQIIFSLFLKASLGTHPFKWKLDFIHTQIKLIFIWMVVHQASGSDREA